MIRKKPLRSLKSGIGGHGDLPGEMMDDFKEPDSWTIITALNRVLDVAQDSQLSDEYWEVCKNPLAYLRQELGLTNVQIVVLAIMIEAGEAVSWKRFGDYLGCSRLSIMVYSEEIEELVTKRWATRRGTREIGGCFEITDSASFLSIIGKLLDDEAFCADAGAKAGKYIRESAGASDAVFKSVFN